MQRTRPINVDPNPRSFPTAPAPIVPPIDPAKVAALVAIPTPQVVEIASVGWYGAQYWAHYSDGAWDRHFSALAAYNLTPIQPRFTTDTWLAEFDRTSDLSDDTMTLVFNDYDWNVTALWWGYGGEGVPVMILQYYPQVDLLVEIFDGYMRTPKESDGFTFPIEVSAGFRSSLINIPRRVIYSGCSAIFGGLINPSTGQPWFPTQAAINENDCPYNRHIGGSFGNLDPATSQPYKDCPRQRPADCDARLTVGAPDGHPGSYSYLGFDVITGSEVVGTPYNQWIAYIRANETALKIPVRVVYGSQRVQDLILLAYESGSANDDSRAKSGFLTTLWVICEGPIGGVGTATTNLYDPDADGNPGPSFGDSTIRVNDTTITSDHVNYSGTFGIKRQAKALPGQAGLTAQQLNYSGTAVVNLDYGRGDFRNFQPDSVRASCRVTGIKNIRVYTTTTAYTRTYTTNRAWCLFNLLTNKRYGFALDYARFNIQEWIDLAAWCDQNVAGFDETGGAIAITRSTFNGVVDSRAASSVLGDFCMTGRFSPPFQDRGKLRVVPLREDEVERQSAAAIVTVANPGFELPALGTGGYVYTPSGAGWTFGAQTGVAHNGSPFINVAPQGTQGAFIQGSGAGAAMQQSLSGFIVGVHYQVKFKTAKRADGANNQNFDVYMDALKIGANITPSSTTVWDQITLDFTATAATHVLKFQGVNSAGGDNTATIDDVSVAAPTGAWQGVTFADFDNDIDPTVRQNIVQTSGKSTLQYSIKSDAELANEVKITFNDRNYEDTERPLIIQDLNRQMLTGRAAGDLSLRVVSKSYAAFGINNMSEAARLGTMLLYYGENEAGGTQNNFTIKFTTWAALAKLFGLHPWKVIRVLSQRVNRFTERGTLEWEPYAADSFQYFRVTKLHRTSRMLLEVEAQLYPRASLQQFAAIKTAGGSDNTDGQTTTASKDVSSTTADTSYTSPAIGGLIQIKQSEN